MPLPVQIQLASAVARGARYLGCLSGGNLGRLREAGAEVRETLEVDVRLEQDAGSWLKAAVAGHLELECQSCLKHFDWPLQLELALRLVASEEEEAQVIAQCETRLVKDDRLDLHEAIEDEILLALPMTPRCANCEAALSLKRQAGDNVGPSPFAALKQQLK